MKSLLTCSLLFLSISLSHGQTPMGYFYDVDYTPIEGYMDDLAYSPKTSLNLTHNSESFEEGSYYTLNGERVDGLIKFQNKKFWYKRFKASDPEKLRPSEVQGVLVGIDSFFVINNFNREGSSGPILRTKPELVQYITSFGKYTFVKHYNFTSGIGKSYGATPITETFLVKENGSNRWVSFPHKKALFKQVSKKYFGHIPYLKIKINEETLDHNDMMTLIKTTEYLSKYENRERLMFDAYWQETIDETRMKYTAKITSVVDSVWTMDYYKADTILATAQYSSFYPYRKNGLFKWYYPSGNQRKSIAYKNDELKEVKLYTEKSQLIQHYRLVKNKVENVNLIEYISYNDSDGNSLLDDQGVGIVTVEDKFFGRNIIKEIKNFKIQKSYIIEGSEKTYQLTDLRYPFTFKPIQRKFNSHMSDAKLESPAADNAQGVILLYLKINTKGHASEYRILNSLHPEIDKLARRFLVNIIGINAPFRHKFKPIKMNKEKVAYEVVVPITFGINRFYRRSYTPYYDPFFMNNHMMYQNNLQHVTPPSFN